MYFYIYFANKSEILRTSLRGKYPTNAKCNTSYVFTYTPNSHIHDDKNVITWNGENLSFKTLADGIISSLPNYKTKIHFSRRYESQENDKSTRYDAHRVKISYCLLHSNRGCILRCIKFLHITNHLLNRFVQRGNSLISFDSLFRIFYVRSNIRCSIINDGSDYWG